MNSILSNKTITKAERQLVQGLISLYLEKGYDINEIDATELEIIMFKMTGRSEEEKRYTMEQHIMWELVKKGSTKYQ